MTAAISIFSVISLARSGDKWLSLMYFLILLLPLSSAGFFWSKKKFCRKFCVTNERFDSYEKWSNILFALLGLALACWTYDLVTTFYAIDVARVAYEVNPLGWPLGALGAFTYYAPTVVLTYVLLFRIKQRTSIYAAIPISFVALFIGAMNLNAGINNFQFFIQHAFVPTNIRLDLLAIVLAVDFVHVAAIAATRRRILHKNDKTVYSQKQLTPP